MTHNPQLGDDTSLQTRPRPITRSRFSGKWKYAIFLAIVGGVIWWFNEGNVCGLPIKYRLGHLDERFEMSQQEVLSAIKQAELWWEDEVGTDLFRYDPAAEHVLTVNMIFDDRQKAVLEVNRLQDERQELEGDLSEILTEYNDLRDLFDRQEALINEMNAGYSKRLQQFERTVAVWNERGGAPPHVYDELQQEQAQLEKQVGELNSLIDKQNELAERINQLAQAENQTVQGFNQDVRQFNESYVTEDGAEEEQGIYGSGTINIYQFEDQQDLIELLAHEMGHALGLSHTYNETELMYPKKIDQENVQLKISDTSINVLSQRCNLK